MKNLKLTFLILLSIFSVTPIFTFARTIINNNGIEIDEEDYERFLLIYSHEYIMTMDETKYEKALHIDYDNIQKATKYVETTYNPSLNLITERELTEYEYENYIPIGYQANIGGEQINLNDGYGYYETTAKKISLIFDAGPIYSNAMLTATWKVIPITRSFDVIGFRGYGFDVREGSQAGEQIYVSGGNYNDITYSWNGTNIHKFTNGFGISMNIVNASITALQLFAECDVEPTIDHPSIYASYQHAVDDLTLAQSQNYTLGGAGLGNVFIYPYNISQKYDGMSGLSITF